MWCKQTITALFRLEKVITVYLMRAELLHVLVKTPLGFKIVQLCSCGPDRLRNSHMATQCALRQPRADHQCPVGYFYTTSVHVRSVCDVTLPPGDTGNHLIITWLLSEQKATWREMSGHADGFIRFFPPPDVLMFVMLTIYPEKAFLSRVRLRSYVLYSWASQKGNEMFDSAICLFFVKVVVFDLSKEYSQRSHECKMLLCFQQ